MKNRVFPIYWDLGVIVASILIAIIVPLIITFSHRGPAEILVYDLTASAFLILDFIYFASRLKSMRRHGQRISTLMVHLDLWASLPLYFLLSLILPDDQSWHELLLYVHLIKLVRIFFWNDEIRYKNILNPSILRLINMLFWIILASHYIALGWLWLSETGKNIDNATPYIKALYWTITTLTTIGYGDITPSNNSQMIYAMFIEILGAGMYGFIIGNIANLITNIDTAKALFREKLERINTFMKYRGLPHDLQVRVNDYYSFLWESRRGYDESSVLEDLPIPLKTQISMYINQRILEKVPLFQGASQDLLRAIILNLEPVVFTPGDFIFQVGDLGTDMYFISRGSVDVVSADGNTVFATLQEGHFFGEIALLLSTPRTASIRAAEYCDLYRLHKDHFDKVISRYPNFAEHIRGLAAARQQETQKNGG